jgi:hypothetical protein
MRRSSLSATTWLPAVSSPTLLAVVCWYDSATEERRLNLRDSVISPSFRVSRAAPRLAFVVSASEKAPGAAGEYPHRPVPSSGRSLIDSTT